MTRFHFSPIRFAVLSAMAAAATVAYPAPQPAGVPAAYIRVTNERAAKIVAKLGLTDSAETAHVRDDIAEFYRGLNAIQGTRDAAVAAAKHNPALDKAAREAAIKSAQAAADVKREQLHRAFIGELSAELTPAQVDQVKDGLTYGVAPLTFRVYEEMLPNLTPAQKTQIHAWLLEAREYAMDGFTSKEKHGWFGKYKGRINNYLAKQGYNVGQAEHDFIAHRMHHR